MDSQDKAIRKVTGEALARASGAELIKGNRIRLLKDAAENYPAWIQAIESARKWIHFEMYILHEDAAGRQFGELLEAKARQGVAVRVIYDWVGSIGSTSRGFYRRLAKSGVEVRCFNRFHLESPFGWLARDHRKLITVDGRIAYVSGLCVGHLWAGDAGRNIAPWRDTGVEIEGPALTGIEESFADSWNSIGNPLPREEIPPLESLERAGNVSLRIVASSPNVSGIYRVDQFIASLARRSIWIADAYFIGTGAYIQALQAAARSGIDVRILIPGANDVPVVRALSRAGLRPLLEAGVRVFEWDGSMMHAKTAVTDGYWSRVGSTNLNVASWLGNRELDVIVEDEEFGRQMEEIYEQDLSNSTEIVLSRTWSRTTPVAVKAAPAGSKRSGGSGRAAAGFMRLGLSLGAAVTNRRKLGRAEAVLMCWGAALLVMVAVIAAKWPKAIALPLAVLCCWVAVTLVVKAFKVRDRRDRKEPLGREPPG